MTKSLLRASQAVTQSHRLTISLLFAFFIFASNSLFAQKKTERDSLPKALETVEVTATRLMLTDLNAPLAVSVLDKKQLQTATQQLSPYEVLGRIPGVFAMNPDNFSQDLRISIRGFGARAAFGIRGIRLFTDGLPEGTPDGQADVDNIDMGVVRQMEILRGAAAGLYGNAAGGVISMLTENPLTRRPLLEAQTSFGSYGFQRFQVKTGQNFGKFLYFINGSHNRTEGYRNRSQMQNTILNGKMTYQFNQNTKLSLLANYGVSPIANDAGGLTATQIAENPRQAGANNLLFETGEAVTQSRIGSTFETKFGEKHGLQARIFYTKRHLENRLAVAANGYGDLHREYGGGGASYQFDHKFGEKKYRLKLGLDIENQLDTRQRFAYLRISDNNVIRYQKDKEVLSQQEDFESVGVFLLQDFQPTDRLLLSVNVRYDNLSLAVYDNYLVDGNQSGQRQFEKVNPSFGINYKITPKAAIYANYATTFETPTLNELSNNPQNIGGFNPDLTPQTAQSFEIGTKGKITEGGHFDLALFQIMTENDLVPYQIQTRTFYRNAGKTLRRGVELGLSYPILEGLTAHLVHTFSAFKYQNYSVNTTVFDGKTLPGIPRNHSQLDLRYFHPKGFFALAQGRYVGKVFANDANTFASDAYLAANLRLGYAFSVKKVEIEPFFGINNLTNANYIANVQINATADRFFEPAARRYFFGGAKFRLQ